MTVRRCVGDMDIPGNAHQLVRTLLARMNALEVGPTAVAQRAGVGRCFASRWRRHSPTLANFEAVLNTVGLELVIREKRS